MRQFIEIESHGMTLKGTLDLPQLSIDEKAPLVIYIHDLFSSSREYPSDYLTLSFIKYAYAIMRVDLSGHGRSPYKFEEVSLEYHKQEIKDMIEYALTLPYVNKIILLGHGYGGMLASLIAHEYEQIESLVLLSPSGHIDNWARKGYLYHQSFKPTRIPHRLVIKNHALGNTFIKELLDLSLEEEIEQFKGNICMIYARKDQEVPLEGIMRYQMIYDLKSFHMISTDHTFRYNKQLTMKCIENSILDI